MNATAAKVKAYCPYRRTREASDDVVSVIRIATRGAKRNRIPNTAR
jgi:hypothetical protein